MNKLESTKATKMIFWSGIAMGLQSCINFLTMPIFTRILSTSDYGLYTTFVSWQAILSLIITLSLQASINTAAYDYKQEFDGFISSILFLGEITIILAYLVLVLLQQMQKIRMQNEILQGYLFLSIGMDYAIKLYTISRRFLYQYQIPLIITLTILVVGIINSFLLIGIMPKQKHMGRILGANSGTIVIGFCVLVYLINKGKKIINLNMWKYGLHFGIPNIFHSFGMQILNHADRVMVERLVSSEAAALYTVPYTLCTIITTVWSSITPALVPLFFSKFEEKEYSDITELTKNILFFIFLVVVTFVTFAPLIIRIMAGEQYLKSLGTIPAIASGIYFQCVYTFYVILETHHRKPVYIALCTSIVAAINIALNAVFICLYGYAAAAYTTLFCYFLLSLMHGVVCKIIERTYTYPIWYMYKLGIICLVICFVVGKLYNKVFIIFCGYMALLIVAYILKKQQVLELINIFLNRKREEV